MEIVDGRSIYAAGDLVDHVTCEHLAWLEHRVALGLCDRPALSAEEALVAAKGRAHEAAYLARLRAQGIEVVEIARGVGFAGLVRAAGDTAAALQTGARVVHGATFVDSAGGWLGVADFLIRVAGESRLGPWRYEVADTKLARNATVGAVIQLCVYGELLERLQGVAPERMHAILGDGRIESLRCLDYTAYYRTVKARFAAREPAFEPYPEPVEYCARCRWSEGCASRRRADDHLSLVAGLRRSQSAKLEGGGIPTVAALASATDEMRPRRLERGTFERLRAQARLQVATRADGVARWEFLPPWDEADPERRLTRGFALLPPRDTGDLYFDMEGDPFFDGGQLEYLFGVAFVDDDGATAFRSFLGHDRAAERAAFEAFVDFVVARRRLHPRLHVYHYAAYEATALKRLASAHGTRELEIDSFLREGVLVDLYEVVRQALRASFESYSLKRIELFYLAPRSADVTSAMGSVVMYERYLATRDPGDLERIIDYNRDDCFSTRELHRWLLERRVEAEAAFGSPIPWRDERDSEPTKADPELEGLAAELAGSVADPTSATRDERAHWLAAQLLSYHRREAKPAWWAFFERLERKTVDELLDDAEALAHLEPAETPPEAVKRSLVHTLHFPPQEHKLKPGQSVHDPATGRSAGTIVAIDDDAGCVQLQRGRTLTDVLLPAALVPAGPIGDDKQRGALVRFGRDLLSDRPRYRALRDLLYSDAPRLRGRAPGAVLDDGDVTPEKLAALARTLDDSYLFVQGPPGSGKTWNGARAIVALLRGGLRVGVAATSHKSIHHMLAEIESAAVERSFSFRGLKKTTSSNAESVYASVAGFIESTDDVAACADDRGFALVAGTAWLFANAQMDQTLDLLVVDEAGQVSLADAIAMGTSARNVLLLGDPMQLAQVTQAHHPEGAGASVLEHLLCDRATVLPVRGVFLPRTFRMHDAICSFVSELAYDGRLQAAPGCGLQRVDARLLSGAGLAYLPVPHDGNVQQSVEEANAIADALGDLFGGTFTDVKGRRQVLGQRDVLVVTPYNAQVRRIRNVFDGCGFGDVRVGTVDKFQGQEAPVVFFSMASSRSDELPRGLEFLFDRSRLNVAVSRARALAVLVCSPALLGANCGSLEHVRMVNALCRFVESAEALSSGARLASVVQLELRV